MDKIENPKFRTLRDHAKPIVFNFSSFLDSNPLSAELGESINQCFISLLDSIHPDKKDPCSIIPYLMCFGSHAAWITALILACSGNIDSGWAELRKAIEFVFYSVKTSKSRNIAESWIHQSDDKRSQKRFSCTCSIPLCYKDSEFSFLKPLVVLYDFANYHGSHANFETLIERYAELEDGSIILKYISDYKDIPMESNMVLLTGIRIIDSFKIIFESQIDNSQIINEIFKVAHSNFTRTRFDSAYKKFGNQLPPTILETILFDKSDEIDKLYADIIQKYKTKKFNL